MYSGGDDDKWRLVDGGDTPMMPIGITFVDADGVGAPLPDCPAAALLRGDEALLPIIVPSRVSGMGTSCELLSVVLLERTTRGARAWRAMRRRSWIS